MYYLWLGIQALSVGGVAYFTSTNNTVGLFMCAFINGFTYWQAFREGKKQGNK